MRVLKFGGTSVGSVENIKKVIAIVKTIATQDKVTVVVSAIGGMTNMLLKAGNLAAAKDTSYTALLDNVKETHFAFAKALTKNNPDTLKELDHLMVTLDELLKGIFLINELSPKTIDKLAAFGERSSSLIISNAFATNGVKSLLTDSRTLIITDNSFTKANVIFEKTNQNIVSYFKSNNAPVTILPGFISSTINGESSTLGRGGSDYTAAIIAAALKADVLEIWTDVSGMYTANPKLVKQAKPINSISYHEAMELSHFGAKVLYPPTIAPVQREGIPLLIKNTLKPEDQGTKISTDYSKKQMPIKGISHIENIALLTIEGVGMVGIPGISKRIFETLSNEGINIILITQASSEHSICLGIDQNQGTKAKTAILNEFAYEITHNKIDTPLIETDLAIIALVGEHMKSHQGVAGRMFRTLGKNNVNIRAIAQGASEKNISAVIAQRDVKKALNSLHERFFENQKKQLNLFIMGVGNVGARLLLQIKQQQEYLLQTLGLNLRVAGIANSRNMLIDENGIQLSNWQEQLENGTPLQENSFSDKIINLNIRNSVFVDVTANETVAMSYGTYLKNSIAVVACNKIACSSSFEHYQHLKKLSRNYNTSFLFETNVGAGLPIIDTLNNLVASGDRVTKIKAVLSGSLNFVFNNFKSGDSFHDVVLRAKEEGFTEPDPRIDLSGIDVARKILILAREAGLSLNLEDIKNTPFLTPSNLESSDVAHFFETLKTDSAHFEKLVTDATKQGKRLKYVAQLDNGAASVGLQAVGPDSDFYNLEGKDNIVLFYTERYSDQPLIVKGAGAGGDVTASGLFSDIIRLRKN